MDSDSTSAESETSDDTAMKSDGTAIESDGTAIESDDTARESDDTARESDETAMESDDTAMESDNTAMESDGTSMETESDSDRDYNHYLRNEAIVYSRMSGTIFKLTDQLINENDLSVPKVYLNPHGRRELLKEKIETLFVDLLRQILENRDPVLHLGDRKSWKNCIFKGNICLKSVKECSLSENKLCSRNSLPKFCLIYYVLGKIYKMLCSGETCTKRELYYRNLGFINDQSSLDSALDEISCLLDCPLYHLNLYATSKGLISGPLKIITKDGVIDCEIDSAANISRGAMIPSDVCSIIELQTNAKFVLLIEKDAVFQNLLENEAMKKLPTCIFVTGKGMPDTNTRSLLKTIWDMLHIPILAFVDTDPMGIDIMCIYRYGSKALTCQADYLAVPSIRWLGPFPSEISQLCDRTASLSLLDKSKLYDLMDIPCIKANKKICFEITYMTMMNFKTEIEDLNFSVEYMTDIYLPHKIALGDFI